MSEKTERKLIKAKQLLLEVFAPEARPSLRWLRDKQKTGEIPSVKVGRLIFFDVQVVRETLANRSLKPVPDQADQRNPHDQNHPANRPQESQ